MYLQGFTPNLSLILLFSITTLWYSLILHPHHLNSQLPIFQHVETPLKQLHATCEEIGLDLEMIIITVGRLLMAHSIPFMLFLWFKGTRSFRSSLFLGSAKEIIAATGKEEQGRLKSCCAQQKRNMPQDKHKTLAVVLVVVGLCHMFLGTSWFFLF